MIGIAIVVGVVFLYVGATHLNGKTEVPESCRDLVLDECESCHSHSCSIGE